MKKMFFLFALLLLGGLGFSQETTPQAPDKAKREAAKKAWKAEGRHAVGLRHSLLNTSGFFGSNRDFGNFNRSYSGKTTANDIQVYYTFRFAKRWRVGAAYSYNTYSFRGYGYTRAGLRRPIDSRVVDYYYHDLRLSVYFDIIQKKHFILRGSAHVSPLAWASGGSYQIFESGINPGVYEASNYRSFTDDYHTDGAGSTEFMLDAIYPINRHFECGLTAFVRLQNPRDISGFSLVLGYKF